MRAGVSLRRLTQVARVRWFGFVWRDWTLVGGPENRGLGSRQGWSLTPRRIWIRFAIRLARSWSPTFYCNNRLPTVARYLNRLVRCFAVSEGLGAMGYRLSLGVKNLNEAHHPAARKLAVVLHRLWVDERNWQAFPQRV